MIVLGQVDRLGKDRVEGDHSLAGRQLGDPKILEPVLRAFHGVEEAPAIIGRLDDGRLQASAADAANVVDTVAVRRVGLPVHAIGCAC